MHKVLVIANQTLAGKPLLDAVRRRHEEHPDTRVIICVPRSTPTHGTVAYDDVIYDAAQIRVDLARRVLLEEGIDAIGEVITSGGRVLIPAFAVGRAQELVLAGVVEGAGLARVAHQFAQRGGVLT